MKITIFFVCYNEALLIKHTIEHYRRRLKDVNFIVYDNCSSDGSVNILKELGCKVVSYDTNNKLNEFMLTNIKNNCWKGVKEGWVIVADMDEWLCITDEDLEKEDKKGVTVLQITGYNIVVNSKQKNLEDVDLHKESNAVFHETECKNICFKAGALSEMKYAHGCHTCDPIGNIKFSKRIYLLKHMDILGLEYKIWKNLCRYERARDMIKRDLANHYTNDIDKIKCDFYKSLEDAVDIREMFPKGFV